MGIFKPQTVSTVSTISTTNLEPLGVSVVGQILETNNYDLFKIKKGNRDIFMRHVEMLVKKISEKDLKVPIEIDSDFNIIDGQHRFFAYKKLGLKFRFFINSTATTVKDIQEQNSSKRDWKINDYLESNIKLGNDHYVAFKKYMYRYDLAIREALNVFGTSARDFKEGNFKVEDMAYYNQLGDKAEIILKNFPENLTITEKLKAAIFSILKNTKLNEGELVSNMIKYRSKMYNCYKITEYVDMLLNVYNYKRYGKNQIHFDARKVK